MEAEKPKTFWGSTRTNAGGAGDGSTFPSLLQMRIYLVSLALNLKKVIVLQLYDVKLLLR